MPDTKSIHIELQRLIELGVTDGSWEDNDRNVLRPWTTVEAAQGWIDFLNSLDPAPEIAEIIQD